MTRRHAGRKGGKVLQLALVLVLAHWLQHHQGVQSGRLLKEQDGAAELTDGGAADAGGATAGDLFQLMEAMLPPDRARTCTLTEHFAVTGDGAVLRVFRLQRRRDGHDMRGPPPGQRRVVFVQHALLDSSLGWLLLGNGSLPFALLDAGYDDVFLGNLRGNRFSRNSTVWNPDADAAYWRFSYTEHAEHDVPAMVAEALRVSGAPSLQYVGYSQGALVLLAGLASRPALAQAVRSAVLLAPAVFVGHISSLPFRTLAHLQTAEVFQRWGMTEFGAHDPHAAQVAAKGCSLLPSACVKWLQFLCGANPTNRGNLDVVEDVMRYLPAGTSTQNMAHWGQAVRQAGSGPMGLRKFDYGTTCPPPDSGADVGAGAAALTLGRGAGAGGKVTRARARRAWGVGAGTCNQIEYGSLTPPAFNFSVISTPMVVFSGGHDTLANPTDVELLLEALPRGVVRAAHQLPAYAHLDFGLGADAHVALYPSVVAALADLDLVALGGGDSLSMA